MPNKSIIFKRNQHFDLSTFDCVEVNGFTFFSSADSQHLEEIVVITSKRMKTASRCPLSLWFGPVLSSTFGTVHQRLCCVSHCWPLCLSSFACKTFTLCHSQNSSEEAESSFLPEMCWELNMTEEVLVQKRALLLFVVNLYHMDLCVCVCVSWFLNLWEFPIYISSPIYTWLNMVL